MHPPTPEQTTILDFVAASPDNLMITARAGCGKTAILEMIGEATPGPFLLVCFNKAVADEARDRLPASATVKTLNSLGHSIWVGACSRSVSLNKNKIYEIFRELVNGPAKPAAAELWASYDDITSGVNLARALGYIPPTHSRASKSFISRETFHRYLDSRPDELVADAIDAILLHCIHLSYNGVIDFNDQVYMPALFGGSYPRFPLVMIDEYQDLSPVNHAIIRKLCRSARQIGVGDEAQAIYAFRGAAAEGIGHAVEMFNMLRLPLSTSFRCPSEIVRNVHWRVPDFRSIREGGSVNRTGDLAAASSAAVICRNNAPLISAALAALGRGQSISVAGTDIGAKLIRIMTKLGPETLGRSATLDAISHWAADRLERGSKSAKDMAECMRIFTRETTSLSSAISRAKAVFAQTGQLTFWTGHKAKGLEFDHVYHLDEGLLSHSGQDPNIRYVIDTRSRESLTYISSDAG